MVLCVAALLSGNAHAQTSALPTLPTNGPIQEQDFPCAIVLCVLAPSGSACQPPINWLVKNFIERGKAWPTCDFSSSPGTSVSYATQSNVACPSGFTPEQASTDYGSVYTGVCLRPVTTCATTGTHAYQPSVAGAACYTYARYSDNGYISIQYFEYVIPPTGVTSYSMTVQSAATAVAPAYNNTFYFNLGGSNGADLAASIIYSNANNSSSYGNGGNSGH